MTNSRQQFNHTDVLRLEIENVGTGLTNLVSNPSGALGAWGWVTPVAGSTMAGAAGPILKYTSPNPAAASYFYTEPMPVVAGQYAGAKWYLSAITGYYRVKFEWLNSSFAVIGSSTQTGYLNTTGDNSLAAQLAPASTAFMRLRFDHYSTTGGANPTAGATVQLYAVTVAKAATAAGLGGTRTNLITNPSFETNTTGWTGVSGTTLTRTVMTVPALGGTAAVRLGGGHASVREFTSPSFSVTAGKDYTFSFQSQGTAGRTIMTVIYFRNASGLPLAANASYATQGATWVLSSGLATAPTGATTADLFIQITGPTSMTADVHDFDMFMVEEGAYVNPFIIGTQPAQYLGVIDYGYSNIIGPSHEIKINREGLNVGTLNATVLDTSLDPATADLIRPGRKCRLMVLNGATWDALYTGKINEADVQYDLRPGEPDRVSRIFISAIDNISTLANTNRPQGVGNMVDLPYVLEGAGVPWNVNGNGNQVPSAVVVSNNDNASALDQIAITRDSKSGYAWVDRNNVAQVWDGLLVPHGFENPSFESSVLGWSAGVSTTIARSTAQAHTGAASMSLTRTGTTGLAYADKGEVLSVTPGRLYTASAYFRAATAPRSVTVKLYFYDSGFGFISSHTAVVADTSPGWTESRVTVVAPVDAAWVSPRLQVENAPAGEVHYVDDFSITPVLNESVYSDLDVSFSTTDCINEVIIKNIEWDPADATKSIEIIYGPYRDEPSIAEWGRYSSEFTTHGLTAGQVATLGASILAKNKTPAVHINSVQVPILSPLDLAPGKALLDLYELVNLINVEKALDHNSLITGITHTIDGNGWLMHLTFADSNSVAAPQVTPPVQSSGVTTLSLSGPAPVGTGFGAGGTTYYVRDGKTVNVRVWAANTANTAANATACTLPVGYRPIYGVYFFAGDGGTGAPVLMYLETDGTLKHVLARTNGQSTLGHVSFLVP